MGHKVSMARMEPGTEGLKGITEITPLAMYTQVRKFLGATGYFRCYIKGYAKIAKLFDDLLQGENSKLKSHPVGLPPDALAAFQELKMKCLTVPVLAFVDFKKPFLLETDTLIEGLGAVLSQEQDDGHYHLVAYASHGLKGGELKYHSSKLEFLALKWAMTEQFREYLQYQPFLVRTDNNPLTYVLTTPNLDAVGHRWVAAMAGYNFKIQYICGLDNKVVDALSHVGWRLDEDNVKELLDQSTSKELLSHPVCYGVPWAESDDPRVTQEHEKAEDCARSSCKCESWWKQRTTRIWPTHSGSSPNGATKLYNWSCTGLDRGRRQLHTGPVPEAPCPIHRTLHLCCKPEGLCALAQSSLPEDDA